MSNDLWSFALALYARPEVERACLHAQDLGANVCLLLCAAWLDTRGEPWSTKRQQQLEQLVHAHESLLIAPLRALRVAWRTAAASDTEVAELRNGLKLLELRAERMLLQRLQQCCRSWSGESSPTQGAITHAWLERVSADAALRGLLSQTPGK